jgi:signal transduction histidine kinase
MGAMKSRRWPDSALLWQAALVILPVAILSAVALYSLRQDKASIEQEARSRASELAPELARRLGEHAAELLKAPMGGMIQYGRITSPVDYPAMPEPEEKLTAADVEANASWERLVSLAKEPVSPNFVQRCIDFSRTGAHTESGAPLRDLAMLLALRHAKPGGMPAALMAELKLDIRGAPSFLTPELLQAAYGPEAGDLKAMWDVQEETLGLMRQVRPLLFGRWDPREIWLWQGGQAFLAWCNPGTGANNFSTVRRTDGFARVQIPVWTVGFMPLQQFDQAMRNALRESRVQIPSYAGVVLRTGGWWRELSGIADLAHAPLLASAPGHLGVYPITIELYPADPKKLYSAYRQRLWLTAGLILTAAMAAMAGLAGLWRNTRRQAMLSEMKSNFVSSVSHELRAPIAAVRLMAESLDRGTVAEESKRKDYFRLIVQECRRLSSLVENVLDFSRIDQGRKQYNFEPVEPVALARQAVALMEPCAAERQVTLTLAEPAAGVEELRPRWDEHAVEQSLVNLIDNAIKHSPAGAEVRVAIKLTGATLRLWVEDHGEGIAKEEQARIFDLFYRHGSELRRETQGAGIGLSIVKHVAEAHGGRAIVESAPGEGSRFALELPV